MGTINSFGNALAWLLLLPGEAACRAMGLNEADSHDLVRMLVNSLVWTIIGVIAVSAVA